MSHTFTIPKYCSAQGWDEFVEDVNTVLNEFDPSFMAVEEPQPEQKPKPNLESSQLAAYAVAASKVFHRLASFSGKWQQNLKDVWNQSPENLPMHIDIPRLITKIHVCSQDGTLLWPLENAGTDDFTQIYSLFAFLSAKLGDSAFPSLGEDEIKNRRPDEIVPLLEEMFQTEVAKTSIAVRLLKVVCSSQFLTKLRRYIRRCYFRLIIR